MPPEEITIHERIAKLETLVEQIMTNHLPHIQKKVDWIFMLLIINLVAIIVDLIKDKV